MCGAQPPVGLRRFQPHNHVHRATLWCSLRTICLRTSARLRGRGQGHMSGTPHAAARQLFRLLGALTHTLTCVWGRRARRGAASPVFLSTLRVCSPLYNLRLLYPGTKKSVNSVDGS